MGDSHLSEGPLKVYILHSTWCYETSVVGVYSTRRTAEVELETREANKNPCNDGSYITEEDVLTEPTLVQHVVMRHYSGAPEVHLSRDTEKSAREWAAHLRRKERTGAYYYAAVIVPLEPVQ